jgi:hypothetical protein
MPRKNVREINPLSPVPVKYVSFAKKDTGLGANKVITTLSINDRWLLARITGPERGTFFRPIMVARNKALAIGPRVIRLTSLSIKT